jgi:hypothetical protein
MGKAWAPGACEIQGNRGKQLRGKVCLNGSDKQLRTDRFYAIPHRRRRQTQARQRDPGIPSYPRQP